MTKVGGGGIRHGGVELGREWRAGEGGEAFGDATGRRTLAAGAHLRGKSGQPHAWRCLPVLALSGRARDAPGIGMAPRIGTVPP